MGNIATWLRKAEELHGETIESIVVGPHDNDDLWYGEDRRPENQRDVLLSREDGLKLLDVDYDHGFGGADCFRIYAWTPNRVFFMHEYDGATSLNWVPRNPTPDIQPTFGGE